ncbi:MAG: mandelate racemase/muconate lactonizing enzyme family protein [Betaproteobacteria bacterium]|jgi:L-alanine-DL-glutamate epimerase-like enolase superfamily enzyme
MGTAGTASSLKIREIIAIPTSFPIRSEDSVTLGVGRAVKRDAVVVKVVTEAGLTGFGEAHHGRAPGAVARLVETTLRQLVLGADATDTVGIWKRVYDRQLASHGLGAASCIGLSGIDMALWDIRAKAVGLPLHRLLGGADRPIPAYAGGISLGYQPPEALVEETHAHVARGYRAVKLRIGDSVRADLERVAAVRRAFGDDLVILTDANAAYDLGAVRTALPGLDALAVGWLEEPFPAHDHHSYRLAANLGRTPLAAGENHYTRFEFQHALECGAITILQPDLSKSGGITEVLRIAHLASARRLPIHPHTSMTGINMAACLHFLCAIDNAGYFEADVSRNNRFRDEMVSSSWAVGPDGCVRPPDGPGLGVEVDEDFLARHPLIDGPAYI